MSRSEGIVDQCAADARTRCRMPMESCSGYASSKPARPTSRSSERARSLIPTWAALDLDGQEDVLEHRSPFEQEVALEDHSHAVPGAGHRPAVDDDLPGARLIQAGGEHEQRALPAAAGPTMAQNSDSRDRAPDLVERQQKRICSQIVRHREVLQLHEKGVGSRRTGRARGRRGRASYACPGRSSKPPPEWPRQHEHFHELDRVEEPDAEQRKQDHDSERSGASKALLATSRKYPSPLFEAMNSPTTAPTMASVIRS